MRTFKKDDRILQTNDNVIAEAILNSGYKEVEATPKAEEEKTEALEEVEATPKAEEEKTEALEEVEATPKRRNKKGD